MFPPVFRGLIGLALCIQAAFGAVRYEPRAVQYDPAKLHGYTTAELIDLLSTPSFEQNPGSLVGPPHHFWDDVKDELVARHDAWPLLLAFEESPDQAQLFEIAEVLDRLHNSAADTALRRFVKSGLDDQNLIAAEYFGKRCEAPALAILNQNYTRYPISSIQLATVAEIFGDCHYRPAAPNLVRSVDAMVMNLGIATHQALTKIYPDAHIPEGRSPEDCAAAWRRYVAGLKAPKGR